jgi:hypothetical protein
MITAARADPASAPARRPVGAFQPDIHTSHRVAIRIRRRPHPGDSPIPTNQAGEQVLLHRSHDVFWR